MKELAVNEGAQKALVRLLVKLGLIDQKAADTYADSDNCPILFFARQGLLTEASALEKVARALGVPLANIDTALTGRVSELLEKDHLKDVGFERWRSLRVVPLSMSETSVELAVANPYDQEAIAALEFELGRSVRAVLAPEEKILALLTQQVHKSAHFDMDSLAPNENSTLLDSAAGAAASQESSLLQTDAASPPIVRLVNKILGDAIALGASDIHITPEKDILVVKARVDGIMQPVLEVPAVARRGVTARIKLLCGMDITEHRKPQDGRLRVRAASGPRDLRISVVPTMHGENIVARILSAELAHVSFSSLGVSADTEAQITRALKATSRVVLVTGPTGSGKTSSLYAALLKLRDGETNIITIEDPIEYRLSGITQIQVNAKLGMGFSEGLRAVLRQDPDVVMIGEIRDGETAQIAMQVAQTGHLVLSTLHTNTAPAAITRLRDLGIAPFMISSSLGCVVAQRLVRRLCSCAKAASEEERAKLKAFGRSTENMRTACGCEQCAGAGYKGRSGVFSILEIDDAVREVVRSGGGEPEIEKAAKGFKSLDVAGLDLVEAGVTSFDEVERALGLIEVRASVPAATVAPGTPNAGSGIARRRVLLVEDEENTRTVLSLILQRECFEVREAETGLEGLEQVYNFAPELIITDLMMPKMSGMELLQKVKSDPRTRHIPVLVLTAADDESNELKLVSGGADDFVSKGSDPKIMVARVHRLFDRSRS
ncbi:MAG: Flp pilus assembly complex ATPase component TadA [Oligoflexia bacterium]|nr:Flp pilus assembly complex ATPase component TadA [Oligoflexia bacterium]